MKAKIAQVLLTTALTLTAALFANQAQATPWTFSTSGIIGTGYDYSGTFFGGVVNDKLDGLNFTIVTTIDPTLQEGPYMNVGVYNYTQGSNAIPFSEAVTLNGVTKTFSGVTSYSDSYLYIGGQVYGNDVNEAIQSQRGSTADGTTLVSQQLIAGENNYGLGLSFNQAWSYTPQASDFQEASFFLTGLDGNVAFIIDNRDFIGNSGGNLTSISINGDNTTVPEPSSIALIGAALLGLVVVRRRSSQ